MLPPHSEDKESSPRKKVSDKHEGATELRSKSGIFGALKKKKTANSRILSERSKGNISNLRTRMAFFRRRNTKRKGSGLAKGGTRRGAFALEAIIGRVSRGIDAVQGGPRTGANTARRIGKRSRKHLAVDRSHFAPYTGAPACRKGQWGSLHEKHESEGSFRSIQVG